MLLGLSHRLAYAIAVALTGFFLIVMPIGLRIEFLVRLLDLPVAAAGLLLPLEWRGIDLWFQPQEWGYVDPLQGLLRHLRVAIPAYVVLFYVPNVLSAVYRRLQGTRPGPTGGLDHPREVPPLE
jgi:hypothetical protein